jgi:hypothetical protein
VSTPSVDEESKRICKSSVYFQGAQQDFLTRQQTFELAKKRRMEVRRQHDEAQCTFAPEISDISRQLVSGNLEFVGETLEDKVNRLAVKDVEKRDQSRGALEQLQYRECTFKPAVNPASQALVSRLEDFSSDSVGADAAAGLGVHERLYRSTLSGKTNMRDDSRNDECTFRPQIEASMGKRFSHVKGRYSNHVAEDVMENIREDMERKEEQLLERRLEQEEQERAACTFTPGLKAHYEEPQRPVVVSGLGRFFELRGLALRKQQEQQERETKVFYPEASRQRCVGVTIPEPFELSGTSHNGTKSERRGSPALDECTFNPHTSESLRRERVRQIMEGEDLYYSGN